MHWFLRVPTVTLGCRVTSPAPQGGSVKGLALGPLWSWAGSSRSISLASGSLSSWMVALEVPVPG